MGIFSWIFIGLIAGAVAKRVIPGAGLRGFWTTIFVGIAGAIVGGFIASGIFNVPVNTGFSIPTFVTAVLGACALLAGYQWFQKNHYDGRPQVVEGESGEHSKHPPKSRY